MPHTMCFYVHVQYVCVFGSWSDMQQGVLHQHLWSLFVVGMTVNNPYRPYGEWLFDPMVTGSTQGVRLPLSSLLLIVLSEQYINTQP